MEKLPEKLSLPKTNQKNLQLFDRTFLQPLFLKVRCPECSKFYRVDTRDVKSSRPQFDCLTCHTVFTVEPNLRDPREVQTRIIQKSTIIMSERPVDPTKTEHLKKCPKCEIWNPKVSVECFKCGVLFSKVSDLSLDEKDRAFPSLMRTWQELLRDYQNLSKHFQFIDQCEELHAVPFALRRYEVMRESQPQDEIAKKMFDQAWLRSIAEKTQSISNKVDWKKTFTTAVLGMTSIFILWGIFHPTLRNLIGVGISMLFIFGSLRYLFR